MRLQAKAAILGFLSYLRLYVPALLGKYQLIVAKTQII
jgi:hypothetical protein